MRGKNPLPYNDQATHTTASDTSSQPSLFGMTVCGPNVVTVPSRAPRQHKHRRARLDRPSS